ncbi:MAG: hypothetical protein NE330_13785 [Lentisphaeraceae bacterium]|nr:hypothetical protein [Lentisphaeraceae bacterium]
MSNVRDISEKSFRALCRKVGVFALWKTTPEQEGTLVHGYFDDETNNAALGNLHFSQASGVTFSALESDMENVEEGQTLIFGDTTYAIAATPKIDTFTGMVELTLREEFTEEDA